MRNTILTFTIITLTACTTAPTPLAVDTSSQALVDTRYVYGYCLFRGGVTLGFKNDFILTNSIETQVRSLCKKYGDEYRKAVEDDTFKGRTDFTESEMNVFRPATSKLVLSEVEKIVFTGVKSELKHLKDKAND